MPIGDCWAAGSWEDGAWADNSWADTGATPFEGNGGRIIGSGVF